MLHKLFAGAQVKAHQLLWPFDEGVAVHNGRITAGRPSNNLNATLCLETFRRGRDQFKFSAIQQDDKVPSSRPSLITGLE